MLYFLIAMLNAIILSFIMPSGVMLNVIMLVVVAPHKQNLCALSITWGKGVSLRQAPATLSKTKLGGRNVRQVSNRLAYYVKS
jgi:hypothetical protein